MEKDGQMMLMDSKKEWVGKKTVKNSKFTSQEVPGETARCWYQRSGSVFAGEVLGPESYALSLISSRNTHRKKADTERPYRTGVYALQLASGYRGAST